MKISREQAIKYSRKGLEGLYYQLPEINGGTTISSAKFTGEHGERTIGSHERIYYILKGTANFVINGESFDASEGDIIVIPPNGTYNFWPKADVVEILLIMELLDLEKLPK